MPVLDPELDGLLAFARGSRVPGGFGWLDAEGRPDPGRGLPLWISGRMAHLFSLAALLGRPEDGELADHGVRALATTFADPEHGGWWSEVRSGRPAAERKEAYPHAFVLLAASSAWIAGRPGAPALWEAAGEVVATRFWREEEGAFAESFGRDWSDPEPYRGANANMHMVEACLAAADASGDDAWARRALRTAERVVHREARAHGWRVVEHFDADWRPLPEYNADRPRDPFRPYGVTPGHGLEWARLLVHLRVALPDPPAWLLEAARGLFARALGDGWREPPGGIVYTTDLEGAPVAADRFHWVVAEAIAAAAVLHAATGDEGDADWHRRLLAFAREHLADPARGSWHHELDEELRPASRTWEGKPDVYHAFQALLLDRLPLAPSLAGAARSLIPG